MNTCWVVFHPQEKRISVKKGTTLLEAAIHAGIEVNAACGGEGICGKCVMRVTSGSVDKSYFGKLSAEEINAGYVLSCASRITGDVDVEVDSGGSMHGVDVLELGMAAERFVHAGAEPGEYGTHPIVKKVRLRIAEPSLENNSSDHERVRDALTYVMDKAIAPFPMDLLREMPSLLRTSENNLTAVLFFLQDQAWLINLEPGDTTDKCFIAIVDVGTTTIVMHIIDSSTAKTVASLACFNSQGIYGAEVTTRIIASEKKGVEALGARVIEDINRLLAEARSKHRIDANSVYAVLCAGNTVMMHFLLGLPAGNIRRYPYIPVSVDPPPVEAGDLGVEVNPRAYCVTVPGISGWVGGDITSGILFTGMHEHADLSMLVDIGTNGEIAVGCSEWLIATSASAGPALEGAGVECGTRAENGAVSAVYTEDGELRYSTIGDCPAHGICGSGIIDLLSVLFSEGIVDRTGRFTDKGGDRIDEADGVKRFVLVRKDASVSGKSVYITEPDIANIITAKAAIYAAMKILLKRVDADFGSLVKLYIGGAFGNYIDIGSAIRIGLLPYMDRGKIEFAGNTSLKGAKIAAFSNTAFADFERIRKITTAYDLMGAEDYVEEFRKAMFLPHTDVEEFGEKPQFA